MLFSVHKNKAARINPIFDNPAVYYVAGATPAEMHQLFQQYARELSEADLAKQTGFITANNPLIPYLPVRSNLFLNGNEHDLKLLPQEMRNSTFLNQRADQLQGLSILYVNLFREILAGRKVILAGNVLDSLSAPEVRNFMTMAGQICSSQGVSLIIMTCDSTLAKANPRTVSTDTPFIVNRAINNQTV